MDKIRKEWRERERERERVVIIKFEMVVVPDERRRKPWLAHA